MAISILYPEYLDTSSYKKLSDTSWHDLGMDLVCDKITNKTAEKTIIQTVMTQMTSIKDCATFRMEVFEDIYHNEALQENILKVLNQVDTLRDFMSLKRNIDKNDGIWTLTRRLKEINEYILCIEELEKCLSNPHIHSKGLLELKAYVHQIQSASYFEQLKKDISGLKLETNKIKSVTLGVNLNEDFQASSVGIVSLNDKAFSQANVLSNFHLKLSKQDSIHQGNEWNQNYTYQTVSEDVDLTKPLENISRTFTSAANPLMGVGIGLSKIQENQPETNLIEYLSQVANKMMANSVKRLKEGLSKYATIHIQDISGLIPEFTYYILWARYLKSLSKEGYTFSKASVSNEKRMDAKGVYNLKLASIMKVKSNEIVENDLIFDDAHTLYVLTGANRGGKTTITQCIGQLYVLAQGGIYIPGQSFTFEPVDSIYTHFPADEDKTMDYGRLGEECNRFKEMYASSSKDSLILLNETFSTTAFEEGYYIASDSIRAILHKGTRTIYNTHMHKLAQDMDELNSLEGPYKAASLIVKSENGRNSFKVELAQGTGNSYASDIAKKYGVTYEQLIQE